MMKQFSSTELANKTGDVLAAAAQEPVSIARHGRSRFVMLSKERYEKLVLCLDARRSVSVADLSDEDAATLMDALQDSVDRD